MRFRVDGANTRLTTGVENRRAALGVNALTDGPVQYSASIMDTSLEPMQKRREIFQTFKAPTTFPPAVQTHVFRILDFLD